MNISYIIGFLISFSICVELYLLYKLFICCILIDMFVVLNVCFNKYV